MSLDFLEFVLTTLFAALHIKSTPGDYDRLLTAMRLQEMFKCVYQK